MRAQVADLDQQIRTEGERLARSFENEAKVAGARLETLSASLDGLKRQSASTSDQDVQLRAFEREAKAQRDLFESYLAKYREASARDSIAAAPADARIISRAVVSNIPFFPKKVPIVLITALGTLALATAFVVTGALLSGESYPASPRSKKARTRSSDKLPAAPTLEPAPPQQRVAAAVGAAAPSLPAAGPTVDDVIANLHQAGEAARRIAVIGSARETGTTLTAIALARALSRSARVVLADLSFGSPNLDVISNEPGAPGIAELVRGTASFEGIITRDRASRAHVVAAGQVGGDAAHLLNSQMLWAAIDALGQSYDYLVIDCGSQTETAIEPIAATAPYAVLVGGATPAARLTALAGQLQASGFAAVTVMSGPPPTLEEAAAQQSVA
jgi:Mrp family chromosome partitioning ATPase